MVFQGASVAFDLSMEEIWVPYLVGASLFVATPEILAETEQLPDILEEAGVTVMDTVPTLLSVLPRDVRCLRKIILGGEACPPAVAERWARPDRTIFNGYGPTEITVVATISQVRFGEPVTIGKPIPNYSCYVVDEQLNLLERGVEGELLIGGPGVTKGYLKRESLTAEKFVKNPFPSDGSDPILYRSGDAAFVDDNGDIVYRGRIDTQIKIRGFRVELEEIEATLSKLPGLRHAAVVLRQEKGLDELVAFLTTDGEKPDPRELRAALRETLPAYMVPARYEFVEALPTLPSGKVDRKALAKQELSAPPSLAEEQETPRDAMEAKLLEAAKRVFPDAPIPFDADFFTDLGGHSLLAARFVGVARETPALARITLQDLYAHRTLRALARHLAGGPEIDIDAARSLLRAAAATATPALRPRAGGRLALPAFGDHRAMARRLRLLSAHHERRRVASDRDPHAARRLRLRQSRDARHIDRRQMARDRPHQARTLPALGRLLLSMVAVAAAHQPDPRQMVPGLAADELLSAGARRRHRQGRAHQRVRRGRHRSRDDRRRRGARRQAQARQCARRGQ